MHGYVKVTLIYTIRKCVYIFYCLICLCNDLVKGYKQQCFKSFFLTLKIPYFAHFQVHTFIWVSGTRTCLRALMFKKTLFFSYCPLLQHLYSPWVWMLSFSSCLSPEMVILLWLVSSHRPEPAPITVFTHQFCLGHCNHHRAENVSPLSYCLHLFLWHRLQMDPTQASLRSTWGSVDQSQSPL